jgi:hypothetical protein
LNSTCSKVIKGEKLVPSVCDCSFDRKIGLKYNKTRDYDSPNFFLVGVPLKIYLELQINISYDKKHFIK